MSIRSQSKGSLRGSEPNFGLNLIKSPDVRERKLDRIDESRETGSLKNDGTLTPQGEIKDKKGQ